MKQSLPIAVIDTNVLVSGFLSAQGAPGRIVEWLRSGVVRAGLDDRIITEYEDVLARPELDLPRHEVRIVMRRILSMAEFAEVSPAHIVKELPDADDAPFVECALALGCSLVSGNSRHFPPDVIGGITLLTPRQFVDAFSGAES